MFEAQEYGRAIARAADRHRKAGIVFGSIAEHRLSSFDRKLDINKPKLSNKLKSC
jgi:hypothetical protein